MVRDPISKKQNLGHLTTLFLRGRRDFSALLAMKKKKQSDLLILLKKDKLDNEIFM